MSKVPVTKLYDSLAIKLGRETADDLITYFEGKIDKDLESKLSIFATKEDLARGLSELESRINESRNETKDYFAKLESKINEFENRIVEKINQSEKRTVEKIHQSEKETLGKLGEYKVDTIRWTLGLVIALAGLIMIYIKVLIDRT